MDARPPQESEPNGIRLTMCSCSLPEQEPARRVLEILRENGAEFYRGTRPDPVPESRQTKTGSIVVPLEFSHVSLRRDLGLRPRRVSVGFGRLGFIASSRSVLVSQTVDSRVMDRVAAGQLEFLTSFYSELDPKYSWIDERGNNANPKRVASLQSIKYVFWVNAFGPELADTLGAEFFSNCPADKVESLGVGGVVVLATRKYSDWYHSAGSKLVTYFAQRIPGVSKFRAAE